MQSGPVEKQSYATLLLATLTLLIVIPTLVVAVVTFVRVNTKDCEGLGGTTVEFVDSRSPITLTPAVPAAGDANGDDVDDDMDDEEDPNAEEPPPHWVYGQGLEFDWGENGYPLCHDGRQQSPINIITADAKDPRADETSISRDSFQDVSALVVNSFSQMSTVVNNGHSIKIEDTRAFFTHNNIWYKLLQFHLHTPSEHTVDGAHAAAEIHLVHQSVTGEYLVISVLADLADESPPFFQELLNDIPRTMDENPKRITLDYSAMVDGIVQGDTAPFWTYPGSFTTPPCTESVTWILLEKRIGMSTEHINSLKEAEGENFRPVQPLNDRQVLYKAEE
eukprot:CAMPEP_0181311164 /NCGR_PEP_ID=MMETSP1101-20121128/12983_1 /TAXON_ID=46948 /ORGANISM="Rhodomonas abbreviata, Strain Caron Lab Isolate" /LENGTH=334 /DNA_ID=CAMNT_0023417861 /DNA_START=138 /DNA_END=1142 /DNA_ORIENTATION=-